MTNNEAGSGAEMIPSLLMAKANEFAEIPPGP